MQRLGERRKTTYLKGPPFANREGLILMDRRSYIERRNRTQRELCALLRYREPGSPVKD